MDTKYIVNNLSDQTIYGNLFVTGTTTSNNTAVYRALFTQTGSITGTSISQFNYGLINGDSYTITSYQAGDDFSNIANVQSGTINETGCVFIATGENPNFWGNNSQLVSSGGLIVDVLENTLGYDISWQQNPYGGNGYYIGVNDSTGPLFNSFPRSQTSINMSIKYPFEWVGFPPIGITGVNSFNEKDSAIFIEMYDTTTSGNIDNALYYTPIEITINQGPTGPYVAYGLNTSNFPYGNISIRIYAGEENSIETIYGDYDLVNNINELVTALNSEPIISTLGTFSVNPNDEDGIILTTTQRIKNQFSPNNELTFEVFND
jgi:hypothetical protein